MDEAKQLDLIRQWLVQESDKLKEPIHQINIITK